MSPEAGPPRDPRAPPGPDPPAGPEAEREVDSEPRGPAAAEAVPRLGHRRKLAYSALILLGFLALLELALRLADPEALRFAWQARQVHRYTTWSRVDLRPGSRARLRLTRSDGGTLLDFEIATDSLGLRSSVAGGAPEPVRAERTVVHCLGDSMTMGWGVAAEEAYPARLGELLGPSFQVLNLGVDGVGLCAARERSRRLSATHPPQVALYQFVFNDYAEDEDALRVRARGALAHALWSLLDRARRHSYLLNLPFMLKWTLWFRARLESEPADPPAEEAAPATLAEFAAAGAGAPPPGAATVQELLDFRRECAERGVRLAVVLTRSDPESHAMARFCVEHGIECLVHPLGARYRIPNDLHFTAEGNRLLAEALARAQPAAPR